MRPFVDSLRMLFRHGAVIVFRNDRNVAAIDGFLFCRFEGGVFGAHVGRIDFVFQFHLFDGFQMTNVVGIQLVLKINGGPSQGCDIVFFRLNFFPCFCYDLIAAGDQVLFLLFGVFLASSLWAISTQY